jgi:hypothetical protein
MARFEIVSDKNRASHERILQRHTVYVPYELVWAHEAVASPPPGAKGFHQILHLGQLPDLLRELEENGAP